jgi:hypothetical protein
MIMASRQRLLFLGATVFALLVLFAATAFVFSQGSLFDQPTQGYKPINISGDTCTSKPDCQQLIVDQYGVMNEPAFKEKWAAIETDCSTTDYCRYKIPQDSVTIQEVQQ